MTDTFIMNWFVPVSIKEKNISGALSVNRSFHSVCGERKGVRLPILPVRVYTPSGYKVVYALIESGNEECLVSKKLYRELNLYGVSLQVLLITADGTCSLVCTYDEFRHRSHGN